MDKEKKAKFIDFDKFSFNRHYHELLKGAQVTSLQNQNPETPGERGGNNFYDFAAFRTENGSSQGQNMALTG